MLIFFVILISNIYARGRRQGVFEKSKLLQFVFHLTVPRLRSWAEHRRGPIWLSGVSECERNEARGSRNLIQLPIKRDPKRGRGVSWRFRAHSHISLSAPNVRRARRGYQVLKLLADFPFVLSDKSISFVGRISKFCWTNQEVLPDKSGSSGGQNYKFYQRNLQVLDEYW